MKKIIAVLTTLTCLMTTVAVGCGDEEKDDVVYFAIAASDVRERLEISDSEYYGYLDIESSETYAKYIYDSNPRNSSSVSVQAEGYAFISEFIPALHEECGIPYTVWEDMKGTRALDGKQEYIYKNIVITWTYHPDKGLEISYMWAY